ncbi:MAG: cupin domain-containing protein [Bacilli bacterium]
MTKREVIENLELHPLEIEGGFFREVYRSRTPVEITALDGEKNAYAASTSIYYLLGCGDVSSMHSVKFDETWHFYASSDTGILSI